MDLEAPNFALEAPRQRFNDALNTVATAARGALATNEFYDLVAIRLSEAVQAVAVAIWSVNASGEITLARGFQLDKVGLLDDPSGQAEHQLLLQRVVDGGPAQVVEPHFKEHGEGAGNPTPLTLLLGPLMIDQKVDAVLEVFQRPDVPGSTQALQLRFLLQICGLASDYLRTAELRQLAARQSLGEHVESYVQEVHRNLDTRPTCYAIANEGRRLIECDRLSVAIKQGRRFVVEAVSGQDTFNARASEIVALNRLATAVGRAGDEIWYAGDAADLPPQIEEV
ncbi:MAG TPA: hemolysin D, partial [Pirellulales bacterium]|nr:hemolysin D [Pirellulales bacterium]